MDDRPRRGLTHLTDALEQGRHATQALPPLAQSSVRKRLFEAVQEPNVNWGLLGSTIGRAHAQTVGSHKKPPR